MRRLVVALQAVLIGAAAYCWIPHEGSAQAGGVQWERMKLPPDLMFTGLAISQDGTLAVSGSFTHVFREDVWDSLHAGRLEYGYVGPDGLIIHHGPGYQEYSRSVDGGATWEVLMKPPAAFRSYPPQPRQWGDGFLMHGVDSVILAELRSLDIGFERIREVPVLRSTDRGATWDTLDFYLDRVYPTFGRRLWAGSEGDLVYSDDLGETWNRIPVDSTVGLDLGNRPLTNAWGTAGEDVIVEYGLPVACLLARWDPEAGRWNPLEPAGDCSVGYTRGPSGTFWAYGPDGLFRLTDSGTWTRVDTAPRQLRGFGEMPNGTLVAGTRERGVFLSTDGGLTWTGHLFEPGQSLLFNVDSEAKLIFSLQPSGLYRSFDFGETWETLPLDSSLVSIYRGLDGRLLVSVEGGGILESSDWGDTWSISHPTLDVEGFGTTDSGTALAFTRCTREMGVESVYRYENGEWIPSGAEFIDCVHGSTAHPAFGVAIAASPGAAVSTDDGRTWDDMPGAGFAQWISSDDGGRLYIAGPTGQVSVDGGLTFTTFSTKSYVHSVKGTRDGVLYASLGDNIAYWDATSGTTTVLMSGDQRNVSPLEVMDDGRILIRDTNGWIDVSAQAVPLDAAPDLPRLSSGTTLKAPYPNPAVEAVHVPFSLARSGNVRITISNLLGQHVATLIDRVMPHGDHSVTWTAGSVGSGLYFVRMETADATDVSAVALQ